MRYNGPPGMMLDLVGPSPDGVDLEWGHPYTDAHPYKYGGNSPNRNIDPSGLDYLDCIAECFRQRTVSNAGTGAFHTGNAVGNTCCGRYPRSGLGGPRPGGGTGAAGSPSTWQHRVCMRTRLSGVGAAVGRVCVYLTIAEGCLDIGAEVYCAAMCASDPNRRDF